MGVNYFRGGCQGRVEPLGQTVVRKPVGIYGCGFCLFCSAIRKEEDRLSHTLGKVLAYSTIPFEYG